MERLNTALKVTFWMAGGQHIPSQLRKVFSYSLEIFTPLTKGTISPNLLVIGVGPQPILVLLVSHTT